MAKKPWPWIIRKDSESSVTEDESRPLSAVTNGQEQNPSLRSLCRQLPDDRQRQDPEVPAARGGAGALAGGDGLSRPRARRRRALLRRARPRRCSPAVQARVRRPHAARRALPPRRRLGRDRPARGVGRPSSPGACSPSATRPAGVRASGGCSAWSSSSSSAWGWPASRGLQTGKLHLPVPAVIVAGPLFRGEGLFMVILFLAMVAVVGPAWCSHLCYLGGWDALAAAAQKRPSAMPRWRRAAQVGLPGAGGGGGGGLREIGVDGFAAAWFGLGFGVAGVGIMTALSRKKGVMVHCTGYCPIGLVATWLGRLNPFRVRLDDNCTECGLCRLACRYDALSADDIRRRKPGAVLHAVRRLPRPLPPRRHGVPLPGPLGAGDGARGVRRRSSPRSTRPSSASTRFVGRLERRHGGRTAPVPARPWSLSQGRPGDSAAQGLSDALERARARAERTDRGAATAGGPPRPRGAGPGSRT